MMSDSHPPLPPAYGQTPQGGHVAYAPPYAHWGLRFAAYLLDAVILVPFFLAAMAVMALATRGISTTAVDGTTVQTGSPSGAMLALGIAMYVAAAGFSMWNQWIRQGRTGCSLGKQWVGIRLVREADLLRAPGVGLAIGRSFAHILDALACYLGFLWPLWDAKRQTFADKVCSTVVITQKIR